MAPLEEEADPARWIPPAADPPSRIWNLAASTLPGPMSPSKVTVSTWVVVSSTADVSSSAAAAPRPGVSCWAGRVSGAASVMMIVTESEAVRSPSLAVSVKVAVALESTCGAVKVVDGAVRLAMVMFRAESWVHR